MPYEKEEDELSDVNWDRFAVRGYESRILGQLLYYCLNFYAEKKNVVPKKRIPCPGNKISMPWK